MDNRDNLPDITQDSSPDNPSPLNWVGMERLRAPLIIRDGTITEQKVSANVDFFVDLQDPQARGIHMSRMYLSLTRLSEQPSIGYAELEAISQQLVDEQQELSRAARIVLCFDLLVKRKSLSSDYEGWLSYPVAIRMVNQDGHIRCQLDLEILYSSTCPCSAALARQLTAARFSSYFNEENSITPKQGGEWISEQEVETAIPHGQRSAANISCIVAKCQSFPFVELIGLAEKTLQIPVQTVVKREDEQEFARLSGENLMFCEDAARRLSKAFKNYAAEGLSIKVRHLESLHSHDAVAQVRFGSLLG